MASEVNIAINAKNNTGGAFDTIKGAFDSMNGAITAISTAFTALSGVVTSAVSFIWDSIKSLTTSIWDFSTSVVNSGAEWESMSVRMTALYGNAKLADDAMKFLADTAAKLPYTLGEVINAATGIKAYGLEIQKWMTPLADVAAFMSIDLPTAASALGRAFTGGAGAADIFREKGVLAMISAKTGIDDLTKLSLPQFRDAMYKAFTDGTAGIAGMSAALGETFTGKLSTLQDYWDAFKRKVSEDVFPKVKEALDGLLTKIDEWSKDGSLQQWAELVGSAIGAAFTKIKDVVVAVYEKLSAWAKDGTLRDWLNSTAVAAAEMWNSFIDFIPTVITGIGSVGQSVFELIATLSEVKSSIASAVTDITMILGSTWIGEKLGISADVVAEVTSKMYDIQVSADATAQKYRDMGQTFSDKSKEISSVVAEMTSGLKIDAESVGSAFDFVGTSATQAATTVAAAAPEMTRWADAAGTIKAVISEINATPLEIKTDTTTTNLNAAKTAAEEVKAAIEAIPTEVTTTVTVTSTERTVASSFDSSGNFVDEVAGDGWFGLTPEWAK